jgi:hypothetical protein
MEQIKANQIIPARELEQNPFVAPPRDFNLNTTAANGTAEQRSKLSIPTGVSGEDISQGIDPGKIDYGNQLGDAAQYPPVPHIKSIKEQIVNMHDDGSFTIDVVLNVEDIAGITEYDIRVAKDAGNL